MGESLPFLKRNWDKFSGIQYNIAREEKNKYLDLFLNVLCGGDHSSEIKSWCNASNVGSVLSHHFMSEIHHICSNNPSQIDNFAQDNHEDLKPLREYLLFNRGWKILHVVNSTSLQKLSCCRELSNLLVTLLPVCFKLLKTTEDTTSNKYIKVKPEFLDIDSCFVSHSKDTTRKKHVKISHRLSRTTEHRVNNSRLRAPSNSSDSEIEIGRAVSPNSYFNQLGSLINSEDSIVSYESDHEIYSTNERKISADNFCNLLLLLLQKICYKDMLKQNLTTSPPSFTVLPFALETLSSIYFGPKSIYEDDLRYVKAFGLDDTVLKLVFIAAGAVIVQPGGLDIVEQQHNTVAALMRLGNHIYSTVSTQKCQEDEGRVLFLFNLLYGSIKLVCHVAEWLSNRKYCGQVIRSLASLTHLKEAVWSGLAEVDGGQSNIVKFVGHLEVIVMTVNKLKVIHIHNSRCLKKRHRKCHLENIDHHHHNILGFPVSSSRGDGANLSVCCISYLTNALIAMLTKANDIPTQLAILNTLKTCGMCCCLDVNQTLNKLLGLFVNCSDIVRSNLVSVVECLLIDENRRKAKPCPFCTNQLSQFPKESNQEEFYDTVDSAIGLSEGSPNVGSAKSDDDVKSFEIYKDMLLKEDDSGLQGMICNHLIRLTLDGDECIKRKIFIFVILPIFLDSGLMLNRPASQNVSKTCLLIMPRLLSVLKNRVLFLNHGGVKHLKSMLDNSTHRPKVLHIFEILIIKDLEENFDPNDPKPPSSLMIDHKNYLVKKSSDFNARVNHENILRRKEELKSRKTSLTNPILCIFSEKNELLEACGDELSSFTKPEIEHTFNLFSDDENQNGGVTMSDLQELRDFWVAARNLFKNSEVYCKFLSDGSNFNILTSALDLVELIGSQLHSSSLFFSMNSPKHHSLFFLINMELFESVLLICLEMTHNHVFNQVTNSRQMLKNLKDELALFEPQSSTEFKLLLDVLLQCSLGQSYFRKKEKNKRCIPNISDKFDDLEENFKMFPIEITDDLHGYEADIEQSVDHKHVNKKQQVNTSDSNRIWFPEACRLMIDLMVPKLNSLWKNDEKNELDLYLSIYVLIFQRLNSYCTQGIQNCRVIYKQNIFKKLLDGFKEVLVINDKKYKELQDTIFTTFALVAKTNISAKELQKIINLFKEKTAPTALLLRMLLTLVDGMRLQPTYLLSYPSVTSTGAISIPETSSPLSSDSGKGISPIIDLECTLPQRLQRKHRDLTIPSAWAAASTVLPMPVDAIWQPKSKSFSFSLWMRMDGKCDLERVKFKESKCASFSDDENNRVSDQSIPSDNHYESTRNTSWGENLHVLSVGCSQLLCEMWINPPTCNLLFRISMATWEKYIVISETVTTPIFIPGLWHYLTVNLVEKYNGKNVTATIDLNVDGLFDQAVNLDYNISSMKTDESSYVLIGQSCTQNEFQSFTGLWHLGSLMFFKEKVFTKETSLLMYALGPDFNNLTSCSLGDETIFISPHVSPTLLKLGINLDILIGKDKIVPKIEPLKESITLIYRAENRSSFLLYPQVSSLAAEVVGSLANILPIINNLRNNNNYGKASQQQPICCNAVHLSSLNFNHYNSIDTAILHVGGISTFIFLFARVVEYCEDPRSQADSLQLVLHLLDKNPIHAMTFHKIDGYSLIFKVLSSSKCKPSVHILKVLIDACLSSTIIDHEHISDCTTIIEENEAIITNTDLLSKIVCNWRIWDRDNTELLRILFASMNSLLRENHPFLPFNLRQLQSVYMLENVILFFKERFYYEEKFALCSGISSLVLKLVSRLVLVFPISTNAIMAICDLLLLLHKDSATFVSTIHPEFYYIMSTFTNHFMRNEKDVEDGLPNSYGNQSPFANHVPIKALSGVISKQNKFKINDEIRHRSNSVVSILRNDTETEKLDNMLTNLDDNAPLMQAVEIEKPNYQKDVELGDDEVDRKIHDAEASLSSTVWYTPLSSSLETSKFGAGGVKIPSMSVPLSRSPQFSPKSGESYVIVDDVDISFGSLGNVDKSSLGTPPEIISSEGEDWDVTPEKDGVDNDDLLERNGLISVTVGLLKILAEVIYMSPKELCHQLISHMITIDLILIFSQHIHSEIRTNVILVLRAYISRANLELIGKALNNKTFHLLSNQLCRFPATPPMVDAFFSIVFNRNFSFEDPCNIDDITDLRQVEIYALVPILSLLPKMNNNISLCHNVLLMLKKICLNMNHITYELVDLGLLESITRTILRTLHSEPTISDVIGNFEQDVILNDAKDFLSTFTEIVMSDIGAMKFQALSDLLHLLSHCEKQELNHCGLNSRTVKFLRECQILCLQQSLDLTQQIISSSTPTSSNSIFESFSGMFRGRKISLEKCKKSGLSSSASFIRKISKSGLSQSTSALDVTSDLVKSKFAGRAINASDMAERFDLLVQKSYNFILHRDPEFKSVENEQESYFMRGLLHLLVQGMAAVMERTRGKKRNAWSSMMWSVRNTLRQRLHQLLIFMMSPLQNIDQRCYAAIVMAEETKCREILRTTFSGNQQQERRLAIFIHDVLYGQSKDSLTEEQTNKLLCFVQVMESAGMRVITSPPNTIDEWAIITEDSKNYIQHLIKEKSFSMQYKQVAEYKLRHKYDGLLQVVSECADKLTQNISLKKNSERKLFIDHVRKVYMERLEVRKAWRNLRDELSHERGVWYFEESYPKSWQMDPTEGPHRIRKRLERCHLNLKPKFFRTEATPVTDLSALQPPLQYLLDDEDQVYDVSSLLYRLNTSEIISFNCSCTIVSIVNETPGEILIAKSGIHFISDPVNKESEAYAMWNDSTNMSLVFFYNEIREVLRRRHQLQDHAVEIFLTNGRTYLIVFDSTETRNLMCENLMNHPLPNLVHELGGESLQLVTQKWREGYTTNYEYLTQLNKMAGRSFNDLMQYPVFPFVLSDYTSPVLDLTNPLSLRNLGRPMPVQDKQKESHYEKTYNLLERGIENCPADGPLISPTGAYHYSSLYSNSGTVLHYMVRLPPYTSLLVAYQDNNFDVPDRLFHCMETCWKLSSLQAGSDVKELIPEFYFLPEFLLNAEAFDFGERQSGECVDDVLLPNWCRSNARLFILVHRQALESNFVSECINEWIDLTFGYKQSGKAAVEAVNVYNPITHFGLDIKSVDDPIKQMALYTMIKTYGQMPKQLFQSRHPLVSMTFNAQDDNHAPQVMPEVKGLKWGSYVGSPAEPEPIIVWRRNHRSTIGSFVPLSTNDVFGLLPRNSLIVSYCKEKGSTLINTTYVTTAALVSWGYPDGILRVKFRKDHQLLPIIKPCSLDAICICASVPDCELLFVGLESGRIDVYSTLFEPSKNLLNLKKREISLVGHKSKIFAICICKSFSIVATASTDGTVIIWDLNQLTYIRYLDDHNSDPVSFVAVSDTSGDIVSVSHGETGSILKLHTINGSLVGTVSTNRKIHSICFSNAPEGISVNVIAGGMENGAIKLWSTWDLTLITEIRAEKFSKPIVCLAFSYDSQHLYAANSNGTVIIWEKPTKGFNKTPKFLPML